jgi:hypothetical protein
MPWIIILLDAKRANHHYIFFGKITDKTIEEARANIIIPKETSDEIWTSKIPETILAPIKNKINAKPFCR